jgi:hypothetical protein
MVYSQKCQFLAKLLYDTGCKVHALTEIELTLQISMPGLGHEAFETPVSLSFDSLHACGTRKRSTLRRLHSSCTVRVCTRCDQKLSRLIVFFDMEGIVHYEYVPQGKTVNQQSYLQVLKRLRLSVSRKSPQKRVAGVWALHHDNALAHKAHSIQVFLTSHGIPVVQQPPYSV